MDAARDGGKFDHEPIVLYSEHRLFAKSIPGHSDSIQSQCFMYHLILKVNSADYHDGVHFVVM